MALPKLQLIDVPPDKLPDSVRFSNTQVLEPGFEENGLFENYLVHFGDLVRCCLGVSIATSYSGKEDFLLFPWNESTEPSDGRNTLYLNIQMEDEDDDTNRTPVFYNIFGNEFKVEQFLENTGLFMQQFKSFPDPKQEKKVREIITKIKSSVSDYSKFLQVWFNDIRPLKGVFYEIASSDFVKTKKLMYQIYHLIIFLLQWTCRSFMSSTYQHLRKQLTDQQELLLEHTIKLEDYIDKFVDKRVPESESEKNMKSLLDSIYLTWEQVVEDYNSLVSFSLDMEPPPYQKGYSLCPNSDEGYRLSKIWEERLRDDIGRISNLNWQAREIVVRNIIQPEVLTDLIDNTGWMGKQFSGKLPDYQNYHKQIIMDSLIEYDFTQIERTFKLIRNVHIDKTDVLLNLKEPTFINQKKRTNITEYISRAQWNLTDEDIYENRTSLSSSASASLSSSSSSSPPQVLSSTVNNTTSRQETSSSRIERAIINVRRILERVKKIKDKSKSTAEHKKVQLLKALEYLDRISNDYSEEGSPEQWQEIEEIYLDVDKYTEDNLRDLSLLEKIASSRHQLPRGALATWTGHSEDFLDFRSQMVNVLQNYEDENTKLNTLKNQIVGKNRDLVHRRIKNARSVTEAFKTLELYYGDYETIIHQKKRALENLVIDPCMTETETNNIEIILQFLDLLQKHDHQHEVNTSFINMIQHRLSHTRKNQLRDEVISGYDDLKEYLLKIQRTNLNLSLTQPQAAGVRRKGREITNNGMDVTLSDGLHGDHGNNKPKCLVCQDQNHRTMNCSQWNNLPTVQQRRNFLLGKKICLKCFSQWTPDHSCQKSYLKYLCEHKINKKICRCKIQQIQNNRNQCQQQNQFSKMSINGVGLGCVGFIAEKIPFINKQGRVSDVLVCYDTYCTHTTINENLVSTLKAELTDMGCQIKTDCFLGSDIENGVKARMWMKPNGKAVQIEALVTKKEGNNLNPVLFRLPSYIQKKYDLPSQRRSHEGWSGYIIGGDRLSLHPERLEAFGDTVIYRSKITKQIIVAGPGGATDMRKNASLNNNRCITSSHLFQDNKVGENPDHKDSNKMEECGASVDYCGPSVEQDGPSVEKGGPSVENCGSSGDSSESSEENCRPEECIETAEMKSEQQGPSKPEECDKAEGKSESDMRDIPVVKSNRATLSQVHICCLQAHNNMSVTEPQLMKLFSTDSMNASAIKNCHLCTNCPNCSHLKLDRPMNLEQLNLEKEIEKSVSWNEEKQRYVALFPHNTLLSKLPTYEIPAKKVMESLERKLQKDPVLLDLFNQQMRKMKEEKVYIPAEEFPELEKMQKSYIVLSYSLNKKDKDGKIKLRICNNSSFSSNGDISFNSTCLPCPAYLERVDQILTRWRSHGFYTFSDITSCYTQLESSMSDANLRRVWLRTEDFGGDSPWKPYITSRLMFGDSLSGSLATVSIRNAIKEKVGPEVEKQVKELSLMDDISCGDESLESLKHKRILIESALESKNLPLKEWTTSWDKKPPVKYLNYQYFPESDSFSVKLKINLSESKRGRRQVADVVDPADVDAHVNQFGWTKRKLTSCCMQFSDPLQLLGCLQNNFKFLLRSVVQSEIGWDTKLTDKDAAKATSISKLMLSARLLTFPRQCLFLSSLETTIDLYHDSSLVGMGVLVAVMSKFPDGKIIYRTLKTKSKLLGKFAVNIVRGELLGCLAASRILLALRNDLSQFISDYKGSLKWRLIGDSNIVLSQIHKQFFYFKNWTASRINEIQTILQNVDQPLGLYKCQSSDNYSDLLTREWSRPVDEIPWTKDLEIPESITLFKPNGDSLTSLPDIDRTKVTVQNNKNSVISAPVVNQNTSSVLSQVSPVNIPIFHVLQFALSQEEQGDSDVLDQDLDIDSDNLDPDPDPNGDNIGDLPSPSDIDSEGSENEQDDTSNRDQRPEVTHHMEITASDIDRDNGLDNSDAEDDYDLEDMIQRMLQRCSKYQKCVNTLARILRLFSNYSWRDAQIRAEMIIIKTQQQKHFDAIKRFRGNQFYRETIDGIVFVRGRNTVHGPTRLFLVPPDSLLRKRLLYSFHVKHHSKAVYLRGQMLRAGFYITTAIPSMRKLTRECPFCRKRDGKAMVNKMGNLGLERLATGKLFKTLQSDIAGPFLCKNNINVRAASKKIYLLVSICEFSRYVIVQILQGLSTLDLLKALDYMVTRFGEIQKIKSDFGTSFIGAANIHNQSLQQNNVEAEEDIISDLDTIHFREQALSLYNIEFEFRSPKASFVQGGVERAVGMVKSALHKMKATQSLNDWILTAEKIQSFVNSRPISIGNNLEILSPNDVNSLKTKIVLGKNLEEFKHFSDENVKMFVEKWQDLYYSFLFSQRKWTRSDQIELGSIVVILDTKNNFGFPSLGVITKIEPGRDGHPRYYFVTHKTKQQQERTLKRTLQSLCLILKNEERIIEMDEPETPEPGQYDNGSLNDSLEGAQNENEIPDNFSQTEEIQNNPEINTDVADPFIEDGDSFENDIENVDLQYDGVLNPVSDNIEVPSIRILHPQNVPAIRNLPKRRNQRQQNY